MCVLVYDCVCFRMDVYDCVGLCVFVIVCACVYVCMCVHVGACV